MRPSPAHPQVTSWPFDTEILSRLLFEVQEVDCSEMELSRLSVEGTRTFEGPVNTRVSGAEVPEGNKRLRQEAALTYLDQ